MVVNHRKQDVTRVNRYQQKRISLRTARYFIPDHRRNEEIGKEHADRMSSAKILKQILK
jgi:hypothetical protein